MIYKVLKMTAGATSTGKPMKKLTLESELGEHPVNIFSDFPHYADITIGSTIDGEIRQNSKGYDNLYSNEVKRSYEARSPSQKPNFDKIIEKKEQSIGKFQDNKELGIKMSSTIRMAVDIACALTPDQREGTMEETIRKWREWLWLEWDNSGSMPPF